MKEIKLTQGQVTLVDDEDFEYLNQFKWCACKSRNTFYAMRHLPQLNGTQKGVRMHRLIMNTPSDLQCDHRDHNGLNNQKSNMRNCTHAQNGMNRINHGKNKYKGVSCKRDKYMASLHIKNGSSYLGVYDTEEEAARSYDTKAKELYGEYANLNFK